MSDAQFRRKMSLCREVLEVLDKIMPGRSRKRGMSAKKMVFKKKKMLHSMLYSKKVRGRGLCKIVKSPNVENTFCSYLKLTSIANMHSTPEVFP